MYICLAKPYTYLLHIHIPMDLSILLLDLHPFVSTPLALFFQSNWHDDISSMDPQTMKKPLLQRFHVFQPGSSEKMYI